MTSGNFRTLFTYNTLLNADSVEWCPIPPYQKYFVCGTYHQVHEKSSNCIKNKRIGSVILFKVTKNSLQKKSNIQTPAILDMKWCSSTLEGKIILAVANADGEICIFHLSGEVLVLITKCCLKRGDEDFLMLSLDWSKNMKNNLICASDSKGNITLLEFADGCLVVLKVWKAHTLEAWSACFDAYNLDIVLSGGDDGKLNVWDTRMEEPIKRNGSSSHNAGVTVLSFHPTREHCLASGSYDERILLWDDRNWRQPAAEIPASGGLWRLKWAPGREPRHLLAACVHGGFEVVDPFEAAAPVAHYKEHASLAYGADWCRLQESDILCRRGQYLMATCSFYDQKLCVSLWDENKSFTNC